MYIAFSKKNAVYSQMQSNRRPNISIIAGKDQKTIVIRSLTNNMNTLQNFILQTLTRTD